VSQRWRTAGLKNFSTSPGGEGPGDEIALPGFARFGLQLAQFCGFFYALGDGVKIEGLSELDEGVKQSVAFGAFGHGRDERFVDLERVDRELLVRGREPLGRPEAFLGSVSLTAAVHQAERRGMPSKHVRRDEEGGVVTVTFVRDDKLNAVNLSMIDAVREAAYDLSARDDLRVLVITAEGRYFTSGLDISELQPQIGLGTDGVVRGSNIRREYRSGANHDLYDFLESIEKPVILAAQSACIGIGIEMGMSCDFRLASDTAVFSLPEVANLAVIPGSGGVSRLTRIIGPHWTKWLAMAGETIDAQQALAIGLIHAVYPIAAFDESVQAFARKLAQMPREALGLVKILVDNAVTADRRSARDVDRLAQSLLLTSEEHHAKVAAFMSRSANRTDRSHNSSD